MWLVARDRLFRYDQKFDDEKKTKLSLAPILRKISLPRADSLIWGTYHKSDKMIKLNRFENDLQFDYAYPDYNYIGKVQYQTMLPGYDQTWSELNTINQARYRNIDPGIHELSVRAIVKGEVQPAVTSVSFKISLPWYSSWWMYVVYALGFSIGLIFFIKRYGNREYISSLLSLKQDSVKFNQNEYKRIIRAIEFPPEHLQAGKSILSYFSTILEQKNPTIKAKISIEQHGQNIRLIIEHRESGEKEVIEKALNDYGLVITGHLSANDFLSNTTHVNQLRTKLEIISLELKMTQQQLYYERDEHHSKIELLKSELHWLRGHIGDVLMLSKHTPISESMSFDSKHENKVKTIKKRKVFISYKSDDFDIAEQIQISLSGQGYQVFFDKNSLRPGRDFRMEIEKHIQDSDLFIFLITPESISRTAFTFTELSYARRKWPHPGGYVLPVMIASTKMEEVPNYLKAVTILKPEGDIVSEIQIALNNLIN